MKPSVKTTKFCVRQLSFSMTTPICLPKYDDAIAGRSLVQMRDELLQCRVARNEHTWWEIMSLGRAPLHTCTSLKLWQSSRATTAQYRTSFLPFTALSLFPTICLATKAAILLELSLVLPWNVANRTKTANLQREKKTSLSSRRVLMAESTSEQSVEEEGRSLGSL